MALSFWAAPGAKALIQCSIKKLNLVKNMQLGLDKYASVPIAVILFLVVLCPFSGVYAQNNAKSFFHVDIPVSSQSAAERKRAAAEAIEKVIVRLSGATNLEGNEEIELAQQQASRYIEQYTFKDNPDKTLSKQLYSVSFSPSEIQKLLQRASLPFWPLNRPSVLVWLVEDSQELGKVVVTDPENAVLKGLMKTAEVRGLPIHLPVWDLEDQFALDAEQIWALNEAAVLSASERYSAGTILVGKYTVTSSGAIWSTWQYFHQSPSRILDFRSDDPAMLAAGPVNALADHLAELYAVSPNAASGQDYLVEVSNIRSFADYDALLDYIQSLAVIGQHRLSAVNGQSIYLRMALQGTKDQFDNVIQLDGKLSPMASGYQTSFLSPSGQMQASLDPALSEEQAPVMTTIVPLLRFAWQPRRY